jgi:hypothetical protein
MSEWKWIRNAFGNITISQGMKIIAIVYHIDMRDEAELEAIASEIVNSHNEKDAS